MKVEARSYSYKELREAAINAAKELPYHRGYGEECKALGFTALGVGPVGRHRDSDALDESNFVVISEDLRERFPGKVEILRFNHWGVGWIEEIGFDASDNKILGAVLNWKAKLERYLVADESHFSELEWERNHPSENECYSEDRKSCPCGLAERERAEREAEAAE